MTLSGRRVGCFKEHGLLIKYLSAVRLRLRCGREPWRAPPGGRPAARPARGPDGRQRRWGRRPFNQLLIYSGLRHWWPMRAPARPDTCPRDLYIRSWGKTLRYVYTTSCFFNRLSRKLIYFRILAVFRIWDKLSWIEIIFFKRVSFEIKGSLQELQ